jgi:hypothetical protein
LRPRDPRYRQQRRSARGQMQKFPTVGKFHFETLSRFTSLDHLVGGNKQLVGHSEAEYESGLVVDHR